MISLDTNVIVRFLVADDLPQAEKARVLIKSNDVQVLWTVLLEVSWVLQSGYSVSAVEAGEAILSFLGIPQVHCDAPELFVEAVELTRSGMALPDAIHLVQSKSASAFATFDKKLYAKAQSSGYSVLVPDVDSHP
jgi:predicted nucleic acid-binding protein